MNTDLPGGTVACEGGTEIRPLASPRREASLQLGRGGRQWSDARPGHFSRKDATQSEWSVPKISALIALWNEGLSTSEIGNRLGVTRNAVVGKVHRLGLPKRNSPIPKNPPAPKRLTLADIGSDQCLWPEGDVGDEDFHFCGAPRHDGRPYCEAHCKRAYTRINTDKLAASDGSKNSPKFIFTDAA